jgi:hypothetical protein
MGSRLALPMADNTDEINYVLLCQRARHRILYIFAALITRINKLLEKLNTTYQLLSSNISCHMYSQYIFMYVCPEEKFMCIPNYDLQNVPWMVWNYGHYLNLYTQLIGGIHAFVVQN